MVSVTMVWKSGRQLWIQTSLLRNFIRDIGSYRLPYLVGAFYTRENAPYSLIDWESNK